MERPIRGHGIGSNTLVTEKRFGKQHKPHNDYLLVSLEMGLFGTLAYIAFLGRIFFYFYFRRITRELWIWNFALLMLSVYFIVISGAQNIVQSILNFPIFMILVAIVYKLNRISRISDITGHTTDQASKATGKSPILRARVVNSQS